MFAAGTSFRILDPGIDIHLWFIISEPDLDADNILIVNLSTWEDWKDQACILNPSDHPFIHHKTVVMFNEARIVPLLLLESWHRDNRIALETPASPALLNKMRESAGNSKRMKVGHFKILDEQGL